MRGLFLLGTALFASFAAHALALECTIEVYGNPPGMEAASAGNVEAATVPSELRLWARARECTSNRTHICLRTVTQIDTAATDECVSSVYACPSIVRSKDASNRRCRRTPTLAGQKAYPLGGRRVTYRAVVRPVAIDNRGRQTQVTFQALSSCSGDKSATQLKSNVVGVNVTCQRGLTMDKFMKALKGKLK